MNNINEFKAYMLSIDVNEELTNFLLDMLEGENTLQSLIVKIEILQSEGININALTDGLMENPFFVIEEPKVIEHNIEVLKKYVDPKELTKVLEMNIDYLTILDDHFEQNIKMVKLLVSPNIFEVLLKAHGEIFTFNSEYLVKRFEFFINNGLKHKIEEFIISKIELFELEEDEINLEELM